MKKELFRKILYVLSAVIFIVSVVFAVMDMISLGIIFMVVGLLLLIGNGIAGIIIINRTATLDNVIKEIAENQTDNEEERKKIEDEIKTITIASGIKTDSSKTNSESTSIYRVDEDGE